MLIRNYVAGRQILFIICQPDIHHITSHFQLSTAFFSPLFYIHVYTAGLPASEQLSLPLFSLIFSNFSRSLRIKWMTFTSILRDFRLSDLISPLHFNKKIRICQYYILFSYLFLPLFFLIFTAIRTHMKSHFLLSLPPSSLYKTAGYSVLSRWIYWIYQFFLFTILYHTNHTTILSILPVVFSTKILDLQISAKQ